MVEIGDVEAFCSIHWTGELRWKIPLYLCNTVIELAVGGFCGYVEEVPSQSHRYVRGAIFLIE